MPHPTFELKMIGKMLISTETVFVHHGQAGIQQKFELGENNQILLLHLLVRVLFFHDKFGNRLILQHINIIACSFEAIFLIRFPVY